MFVRETQYFKQKMYRRKILKKNREELILKTTKLQALWQRRDRLHIMAEIMKEADEGELKTKIMYKVNLSFSQVNEYLTFLTQKGFINVRPVKGKKVYQTTAKGHRYIKNYMEMSDRLNTEESVEPQVILN